MGIVRPVELIRHRLSFRLGQPKGNVGGASWKGFIATPEPKMYSLPFNLGDNQGNNL